jgi:PAS domain S-box-containing protein
MLEFFEQLSGPEESTREIAARRKAEELSRRANIELTVQINDLRAEEERFRLLTESAVGYALIFLDVRGNVESWNAGAERLKGYRADEIIGRHFSCFHPPEAMTRDDLGLRLKVAAAGERVEDEGWRVRKDGSRFWANVVITALRDQEGRLRGFANLTRDLTERKRAEDDIRKLNEELDQRIVQRTADLAEANRELAQKNQDNEVFVYSASHDLRSPLVNLEGFSKELGTVSQEIRGILVSNDLPPAARARGLALLDGDMAESIRFIRAAVLRLSKIIDALLRLSRAGKVEYLCQKVDVGPIVARVVEALSGTIAERRAVVTVGELPCILGDPAATEMMFANLIANALNYLDARRPGTIAVGCKGQEKSGSGRHVLYVKDNGLGIAEAYKAKVFKAFQRMHPDAAKGEGIGLSVVQRIVERLGGRIWFDSEEGQGTTFFVALPSLQESTCSAPPRSDNAPVLLLTGDKGHGH